MEKKEGIALGKTLKALRARRGMSQKEAAQRLNLSQQALSNYEREVNFPLTAELIRIADFFGVTLDELVYGTGLELQDEVVNYHIDFLEDLTTGAPLDDLAKKYSFVIDGETLPPDNVKRILEQIEFEYYKYKRK